MKILKAKKTHFKLYLLTIKTVQNNRIIGGNRASNNSYPWSVSLFSLEAFNCSGTIISENFVLTAADCVQNQSLR